MVGHLCNIVWLKYLYQLDYYDPAIALPVVIGTGYISPTTLYKWKTFFSIVYPWLFKKKFAIKKRERANDKYASSYCL